MRTIWASMRRKRAHEARHWATFPKRSRTWRSSARHSIWTGHWERRAKRKTDIRHLMLGAGVRASGDIDFQMLEIGIILPGEGMEFFHEHLGRTLRAGHCEGAETCARTGHHIQKRLGIFRPEADGGHRLKQRFNVLFFHAVKFKVLTRGVIGLPVRKFAGKAGNLLHLVGRKLTKRNPELHPIESGLTLGISTLNN